MTQLDPPADQLKVICETGCEPRSTLMPVGAELPNGYLSTLSMSASSSLLVTDRQIHADLQWVVVLLIIIAASKFANGAFWLLDRRAKYYVA